MEVYNSSYVGGFGEVRVCLERSTGIERAVKIITKNKMDKRNLQLFKNEIKILKQLDHPNIVKLFEIYEDETRFYLI